MVVEVNKKETIIIWELTEDERKALASIIVGHGNGKKAALKTGVNRSTLKYISLSGKGYKKNIQRIRRKLLEPIGINQSTKDNNGGIQQESGLGKVIA